MKISENYIKVEKLRFETKKTHSNQKTSQQLISKASSKNLIIYPTSSYYLSDRHSENLWILSLDSTYVFVGDFEL